MYSSQTGAPLPTAIAANELFLPLRQTLLLLFLNYFHFPICSALMCAPAPLCGYPEEELGGRSGCCLNRNKSHDPLGQGGKVHAVLWS